MRFPCLQAPPELGEKYCPQLQAQAVLHLLGQSRQEKFPCSQEGLLRVDQFPHNGRKPKLNPSLWKVFVPSPELVFVLPDLKRPQAPCFSSLQRGLHHKEVGRSLPFRDLRHRAYRRFFCACLC